MPETDTEKLQRRNRELAILNIIAQALNRSVDLDEALQAALAQVADLFGLETGWIWLLHEETGASYLAAAQNLPPGLSDHPERMTGSCYCLDTYRAGDMDGAANVNVITCSRLKNLVDGTDGLRYHASVPLYAPEGRQLGVLNVASSDWRELSAQDLELLHTVGDLLSIAVERAQLFGKSVDLGMVRERNRLAREIHDTLAQGLSGIVLQLETLDALLEAGTTQERLQPAVQRALTLARSNLEEARRSVLDLRAAPLEGRSLADALAGLAQEVQRLHGYQVAFDVVGGGRPLPVRIESGLYRVAQEALNNVAHHAQARQATMHLVFMPHQVQLSVEDDGQGFDPERVAAERYGLVGLRERVNLLGGQFRLQTDPGAGTRLEVTVPLT